MITPGTATIARITDVVYIPGADHIECARVGELYSVVKKGTFQVGDLCVWLAERCVLSEETAKLLGAEGNLFGKHHDTVKRRLLCGCPSDGVALPVTYGEFGPYISILPNEDGITNMFVVEGDDVSKELGIHTTYPPTLEPVSFDFS